MLIFVLAFTWLVVDFVILCTYGAFDCKMVVFSGIFGCPLNLLRMDSSYGFALMFWDRFFWGILVWFISELASFTSLSLFRSTLSWVLWFWWIFNLQLSVPDPLQVLYFFYYLKYFKLNSVSLYTFFSVRKYENSEGIISPEEEVYHP